MPLRLDSPRNSATLLEMQRVAPSLRLLASALLVNALGCAENSTDDGSESGGASSGGSSGTSTGGASSGGSSGTSTGGVSSGGSSGSSSGGKAAGGNAGASSGGSGASAGTAQTGGSGGGGELCVDKTGGAFVDFEIAGDTLRVWIENAAFVGEAERLLDAHEMRVPVFNTLVDGQDCDPQWSWHPDPSDVDFADFTIELCDGTPSYIEENKAEWFDTVGSYCPWSARVTAVTEQ